MNVFHWINVRLQQIRENNRPFGGLALLALGDFQQKHCTFGIPLHRGLLMSCLALEQLNSLGINSPQTGKKVTLSEFGSDRKGMNLAKSLQRFNLTQQMRAAQDQSHADRLQQMRNTNSDQPVCEAFLQSLQPLTKEAMSSPEMKNAKIAALSWREIYPITLFKMHEFARENNLPIIKWRKELVGASASFIPADEVDLVYQHEDAGMHEYFVQGMPGTYTRNISVANGIVNGADCIYVSLTPAEGTPSIEESIAEASCNPSNWINEVLVVFLPVRPLSINTNPIVSILQRKTLRELKFTFNMSECETNASESSEHIDEPSYDNDVLPITLGNFSTEDYTTTSEYSAQESVPHKLKIQRFDVIPFYACTDFKMQGRTVESLIVLIGPHPFPPFITLPALYVLASRVKLSKNLFTLGLNKNDMDHLRKLIHSPTLIIWEAAYDEFGFFSPEKAQTETLRQIEKMRLLKSQKQNQRRISFVGRPRVPKPNTVEGMADTAAAAAPAEFNTGAEATNMSSSKKNDVKCPNGITNLGNTCFSNAAAPIEFNTGAEATTMSSSKKNDVKCPNGITNLGNTCFSNSVIQALNASAHFNQFRETLSEKLYKFSKQETPSVHFTEHLFTLLLSLNSASPNAQVIDAHSAELLQRFPQQFSNRRIQYDAHEFLKYACNEVENALIWTTRDVDKDMVAKCYTPFHGEYVVHKVCRNCGAPRNPKSEIFEDLCLEITHGDISAQQPLCASGMIKYILFLAINKLFPCDVGFILKTSNVFSSGLINTFFNDSSAMAKCENCSPEKNVYTNQTTSLFSAPAILTLQIKRFSYNALTDIVTKKNTCVTCEKMLTFLLIDGRTATYKHIATISHVGSSINKGHYISYTRLRDEKCFVISDKVVTGPFEDNDVFDSLALSGGGPENITPYIVLYDLISLETIPRPSMDSIL